MNLLAPTNPEQQQEIDASTVSPVFIQITAVAKWLRGGLCSYAMTGTTVGGNITRLSPLQLPSNKRKNRRLIPIHSASA